MTTHMFYRTGLLTIFVLFVLASTNLAQQVQVDRLHGLLHKQKQDAGKVNTLIALCDAYRVRNLVKSAEYGRQAAALAHSLSSPGVLARAQISLGWTQQALRLNKAAKENFTAGLKQAEELKNGKAIAMALRGLGKMEENQGHAEQARSLYKRALESSRESRDSAGIAAASIDIGIANRMQGKFELAKESFQQALKLSERLNDTSGIACALLEIGNMERRVGNAEQAEALLRQSLLLNEALGNASGIADGLCQIGSIRLSFGETGKATELFNQSLAKYEELCDSTGIANVFNYIGHIHNVQGRYKQAADYYRRGLKLQEQLGNRSLLIGALISIGSIEFQQSSFEDAMISFQRSLKLCEEFDNRILMASAVIHIGRIHMTQRRYELALEYYERGMKLFEDIGDLGGVSVALNFIADIYTVQGNYDKALRYYYRGLAQFEKEGEKWLTGQVLNSIGVILLKLERNTEAMQALQRALKLRQGIEEQSGIAETLTNIAIIHLKQGNYDSALTLGARAFAIAKDVGAIAQLKEVSKTLSDVYAQKHDFSKAYEFHKEYTVYKDSLINAENVRSINEMTAKYEAETQEQKIALLEKDKTLQNLELTHQQEELLRQQLLSRQKQQMLDLLGKEKKIQELTLTNTNAALERQRIENARKNNEVSLLTKDKLLQSSLLERETLTRNVFIAGMFVLLILTGLLLHRYRYRKRTSEQLSATLNELRQTQAQLIHAEKMVTLGEMTAGMAHEIKNPLNFVTNFSRVAHDMLTDLEEEPDEAVRTEILSDLRQNLSRIQEHGRRADSIVQGMMLHARGGVGECVLSDINALVDDAVNFAYHGMRATHMSFDVTLIKNYDQTAPELNVFFQEISRVLLNLLNNAMHAVRDIQPAQQESASNGGKETDTDLPEVGQKTPTIWISTAATAKNVEIRVRDNGTGIPAELQQKIFQPFFTTKPSGEGTGLGLSISYDIIVSGHGGMLTCSSSPGEGAEFVITLPRESAPPQKG
ncbi:MAG: tetratricopeptide repeat protein [Bacteroidota bacterium]